MTTAKKTLLVIGGATASGKTGLAVRLAQFFQTEILSADSRQFYREMSIGTARPTEGEMGGIRHHFMGHLSVATAYSVGDFERDGMALLSRLFEEKDLVILAGGSGMYIKALCEGLDVFPETTPADRSYWEHRYQAEGLSALQEALRTLDPTYYAEVDLNNPHRLIRALSVCRASGQPFSSYRSGQKPARPFHCVYIWLSWNRAELYRRIDERVLDMIQRGLLEEAQGLIPHRQEVALQTVGYQELFDYLDGKRTMEEAIALIQQNSRRYAKRQLTWSRRDASWKHFHPAEWELLLAYVQEAVQEDWGWEESEVVEDEIKWRRLTLKSGQNPLHAGWFRLTKKGVVERAEEAAGRHADAQNWVAHELRWRVDGAER